MASISATLDVEVGPVCRAGLDVLDLVREILPRVIDPIDRQELTDRAKTLIDLMETTLRGRSRG